MTIFLTVVATVWAWSTDAGWAARGLLVAGLLVQVALAARFLESTLGEVGGHAEWVRAMGTRRRLGRSAGWAVGVGLALAGLLAAVVA